MPQEGVYYEKDYYFVGGDVLYCRLFFNWQYGIFAILTQAFN